MGNDGGAVMPAAVLHAVEQSKGIFLDIGCSDHKSKGSIGMDIRAVDGVDIVHDIEKTPWPLPPNVCKRILASHIIEHLDPKFMVDILNEAWRVMQPEGQFCIAMPYAGSPRFWQDPTHKHAWSEVTAQYWDCDCPLWEVYRPRCWKIEINQWESTGDIQVVLSKRDTEHGRYCVCLHGRSVGHEEMLAYAGPTAVCVCCRNGFGYAVLGLGSPIPARCQRCVEGGGA